MSSNKHLPAWGIALCASLLTGAAIAEPSTSKPIEITADSAEHDEAKRTVTYSGNVVAVQGPFTVHSDTLTLYQPENGPQILTAEGNPVRLHQAPYEDREEVNATSARAEYDVDGHKITLIGDAELIQKGDRVKSDRIVYDLDTSIVRAGAAVSGTQRVQTVIQPRK